LVRRGQCRRTRVGVRKPISVNAVSQDLSGCWTEGLFSLAIACLAFENIVSQLVATARPHRWVTDMERSSAWRLVSDCLGCTDRRTAVRLETAD